MLTIILCWIVISAAIIFIGKLFIRNLEWYEYFWMGLVIVFAILQIWSIFLPVNVYALAAMFALAASSLLIFRKVRIPKVRTIKEWLIRNWIFILVTSLALIAISYYASQSVGWDDTLLYHLNAVKWAKLYPVVRGLANLHSRLGFNSSLFLFASMLDNWFMNDRSSHLALSVLASFLSVEIIWILLKSKDRYLKLFCLFSVPLMVYSIAYREIIASLSPDFALTILVLATAIEFIKKEKLPVLIATFLSVLLITIKFDSVFFAILIFLIALLRYKRDWKRFFLVGIVLIIPYLVRNVYLSGWPLYPLAYFGFKVDWAMPVGQVKDLFVVIQTWAKVPGTEWSQFINAPFWKWFPLWYQNNQGSAEVKLFVFAFLLSGIFPLLKTINKKFINENYSIILLMLAAFVSALAVFFAAPDIRFNEAFIWLFFASTLSLFIGSFVWNTNIKYLIALASLILLFFVSWPVRFDTEPIIKSVRWEQAWPTIKVNGILKPTNQNFCGNSDLPCSPEDNKIKFRVPGDLSKGFASDI